MEYDPTSTGGRPKPAAKAKPPAPKSAAGKTSARKTPVSRASPPKISAPKTVVSKSGSAKTSKTKATPRAPGSNGPDRTVIQQYLDRYERLVQSKSDVNDDIKTLKKEMKDAGLDARAMVDLYKLQHGKLNTAKSESQQLSLESYARAMGVTFEENSVLSGVIGSLKGGDILTVTAHGKRLQIGLDATGRLWSQVTETGGAA
ncbi:MAG: GapR family DNA-binding domain-containing protein [Sphingomonadales bacterium]